MLTLKEKITAAIETGFIVIMSATVIAFVINSINLINL